MTRLTHIDSQGAARMVDIATKPPTHRVAIAQGFVCASAEVGALLTQGRIPKGDPLPVARLAGIMAAKRTADLVPLCHPLPLERVQVWCDPFAASGSTKIRVRALAATTARTGVEMEALTAVVGACLALYDMIKAVDKAARIDDTRLLYKAGGRSGLLRAEGLSDADLAMMLGSQG